MNKEKQKVEYKPYKGGGGPEKNQADNNTKHLGQELKKIGIEFKEDRAYAKKLWDGDDLNLKLQHPKTKKTAYIGYDRWGFVSEGLNTDLDQASLQDSIDAIKNWIQPEKNSVKESISKEKQLTIELLTEKLQRISGKKIILEKEEEDQALYILNSRSKIKTLEPNHNEYVEEGLAYFLLKLRTNGRKIIVSGSGKADFYGKAGNQFYLFDDGNRTTSFPSGYNQKLKSSKPSYAGLPAKIIATADTPEEIKKFPTGSYQLFVMK
jgi:hypothetical protein